MLCVADLYSNFTIQAGNVTLHVNGNQTLGENLADMGGIANSFRAYTAKVAADAAFAAQEALVPQAFAGLAAPQLYFVAWGQNWCTLMRADAAAQRIATDVHSPPEIRVLGPISQTSAFESVFNCKAGAKYAPVDRCSVW